MRARATWILRLYLYMCIHNISAGSVQGWGRTSLWSQNYACTRQRLLALSPPISLSLSLSLSLLSYDNLVRGGRRPCAYICMCNTLQWHVTYYFPSACELCTIHVRTLAIMTCAGWVYLYMYMCASADCFDLLFRGRDIKLNGKWNMRTALCVFCTWIPWMCPSDFECGIIYGRA